jgi:hypothetical protein
MGYSQAELEAVQAQWNLRFPPDLVELLREHRPLLDGPASFDWLLTTTIQERVDWPYDSFWYDVEHNNVWWPEWGEKPSSSSEQRNRLKEIFGRSATVDPALRPSLHTARAIRKRKPHLLRLPNGRDLLRHRFAGLDRAGAARMGGKTMATREGNSVLVGGPAQK